MMLSGARWIRVKVPLPQVQGPQKKSAKHWEQLCYTLDELTPDGQFATPSAMIFTILEGVYSDYLSASFASPKYGVATLLSRKRMRGQRIAILFDPSDLEFQSPTPDIPNVLSEDLGLTPSSSLAT
jgi:hypothetical protein